MAARHRARPPREADSLLEEIKIKHKQEEEKKKLKNAMANAVDPARA